ncbi:hypothetical protein LIER_28671 [Lithospermum erythrorhizon]|uniref:Uncharacterized protein n=1 Tax=Lithospermum erythrorhizon TaxID=34254 RepID=A0AAV3RGY2_LITER
MSGLNHGLKHGLALAWAEVGADGRAVVVAEPWPVERAAGRAGERAVEPAGAWAGAGPFAWSDGQAVPRRSTLHGGLGLAGKMKI